MKTKFTLLALLSMGITSAAMATDTSYCGSGTLDPIVGQYIGAHPDDTVATQLIVNTGGTATVSDVNFIGSNETWTGGFNNPAGTVATGGNITWRSVQTKSYKIAISLLAGTSTTLSSVGDVLGAFPTKDFFRIAGTGTMKLSSDCKVLNITFNGCQYSLTDYNLAYPANCVPVVQLKMFKVKSP